MKRVMPAALAGTLLLAASKGKWNQRLGTDWDVSKHWSVVVEAGVGGSRENLIAGFTYRW
jgi:hypothetical protein